MFEKKRRPSKESSILHLVAAVLLMSMTIYLWQLTGCPWYTKGSFCKGTFSEYVPVLPANYTTPPLQPNDFTKLIDLDNFTFTMNSPMMCNSSDPLLLALVHSHPSNFVKRATIRSTWGSVISNRFKLLFLVGLPSNKRLQTSLEKENKINADLVQGNFMDSYRNMTYKHVMALKWAIYFCPNSKYVLKTDDDVFVNTPALLDYISNTLVPQSVKQLLQCSPIKRSDVKRSSRSKWKVRYMEYRFPFYPTYCQGFAILYSPDVVFKLYSEAQFSSYFWIDDVHITGLLAAKAKYKPTSFGQYLLKRDRYNSFLRDKSVNSSRRYLVGPFDLCEEEITLLWDRVYYSQED